MTNACSGSLVMNTEAWLLHKTPSGDTSTQLSLFTPDEGMVTCLYKGGRTPGKQAVLQPFAPLWVSLDRTSHRIYVRRVESLSLPLAFQGDALFSALYVNELIYYTQRPFDPCPQLYEVYDDTLRGLAQGSERLAIETLLRQFEWALLGLCGYALTFEDEGQSESLICSRHYHLLPGRGFVAASDGFPGQALLAISAGHFAEPEVLGVAKSVMRLAVNQLLGGRELKSRSLFGRLKSRV